MALKQVFPYAARYPFTPDCRSDQIELFTIVNIHKFFHCAGPCSCNVLISQKKRTCKRHPSAIDDKSFVNTSYKSYLGVEHCPGRRKGKHLALKLILHTDLCFVMPFHSKIRTYNCDIHRD